MVACRSEISSIPRRMPYWTSVWSRVSTLWKYIPDVHDTITAIRAFTERRNSAAGTIQVLTYLLYDGKKFRMTPARTMSAGRLGFHICDTDFCWRLWLPAFFLRPAFVKAQKIFQKCYILLKIKHIKSDAKKI